MYKEELIKKIARETRLSQRIVSDVLGETTKQISNALVDGKKVQLLGFGTFEARHRPESKVKHIRTGKTITVPARFQPIFRAGEILKRAVRKYKAGGGKKRRLGFFS